MMSSYINDFLYCKAQAKKYDVLNWKARNKHKIMILGRSWIGPDKRDQKICFSYQKNSNSSLKQLEAVGDMVKWQFKWKTNEELYLSWEILLDYNSGDGAAWSSNKFASPLAPTIRRLQALTVLSHILKMSDLKKEIRSIQVRQVIVIIQ